VGTAEYVSPEIILNQKIGLECDIWSFGIIIYQFFMGETPFKGVNNFLTLDNVVKIKNFNLTVRKYLIV
jgi:serine/threonine protein kinase